MKIEINITKMNLVLLVGTMIILLAGVYAYNELFNNSSSAAVDFGHSGDEVNVWVKNMTTLNDALSSLAGVAKCRVSTQELAVKGCPVGSYLMQVNTDSPTNFSYCRIEYTNESYYDNAGHPITPNCYSTGGGSGGTRDACTEYICDASTYGSAPCCYVGSVTQTCSYDSNTGTYYWKYGNRILMTCP